MGCFGAYEDSFKFTVVYADIAFVLCFECGQIDFMTTKLVAFWICMYYFTHYRFLQITWQLYLISLKRQRYKKCSNLAL
jgi:hypothetical protein